MSKNQRVIKFKRDIINKSLNRLENNISVLYNALGDDINEKIASDIYEKAETYFHSFMDDLQKSLRVYENGVLLEIKESNEEKRDTSEQQEQEITTEKP